MTTQTIILSFVLAALSCQNSNRSKNAKYESFKIEVKVVPEGNNSYSITWNDTLGQSDGYKIDERPFEVWCFITDKTDTVGYYKGRSTPSDYTYFSTTDTNVTATFLIGPNVFSEQLSKSEKKIADTLVEFNSISLNLKDSLRKPIKFVLPERRKLPLSSALK